jgi:hypothetical protein
VQRHLEHARDDLRGAGEALRRRQDQGELRGREAAVAQQLLDHHRRRDAIDLEHQHAAALGGGDGVAVAQFGEQRFLAGQRARRTRAEREELLAAGVFLAGRKAPAGVLAGQAGQHRLAAAHLQPGRPAGRGVGGALCGELHAAQAAHADLADEQSGLDAAGRLDARIDDAYARRVACDRDAQAIRLVDEALHQGSCAGIDAERVLGEGGGSAARGARTGFAHR